MKYNLRIVPRTHSNRKVVVNPYQKEITVRQDIGVSEAREKLSGYELSSVTQVVKPDHKEVTSFILSMVR